MDDKNFLAPTKSDADSNDTLALPPRSPRKDRKKGPVFFVSDEYDCIITAPPESKDKVGAYFSEITPTVKNGYENIGYEQDCDCQSEPKKVVPKMTGTSNGNASILKKHGGGGGTKKTIVQGWRPRSASTASPGTWRMDNETQPILDLGRPSLAHMEDIHDQHRNAYPGMNTSGHGKLKHHKHHKRAKSDRSRSKKSPRNDKYDEEKMILPPNQQVQFILGNERHDSDENLLHSDGTPCLFTEMEQLKNEDGEMIWKETARWIKFEECVEEGGDRWSKPHVSTLSLHSLFELRSCVLNGVVLLDMVAKDFGQISDLVLEHMVSQGHLPHDDDLVDKVRAALLSGHEHQGEKKKGLTAIKSVADFMSRRDSDSHLKTHGLHHTFTAPSLLGRNKSMSIANSSIGRVDSQPGMSEHDKKCKVPYFMKKIPTGAEAANVLIGEVDFLEQRIIAFIRLQDSVNLGRLTEVPISTRFIFLLLGPTGHYQQYHEIGRSIATLMADEVFHEVAYKAKTRKDLLAGIDEFLDQVTVLPPGEWDSNIRIEPPKELPGNQKQRLMSKPNGVPYGGLEEKDGEVHGHGVPPELKRTGRLFGGLINDIKRKAPFYISDFTDCFSIQCLASFIFLYFAILTPIVTFGGLLGDATKNYIGTMESIFGGAISGIAYHLFSGQPLTIIGSTGPILVFETIMFNICQTVGLEYISFRFWIGLWTGAICILLVAFDVSSLITYVTRFTEESFSALISFIFIYEAFKKLIHEGDSLRIWYNWDPADITNYTCQCAAPNIIKKDISYNVTVEEMKKASREALSEAHAGEHKGLLYKMSNTSYTCAYHDEIINISDTSNVSWSNFNKTECLSTYCGRLEGASCLFTPDAILMSVLLFFGTFTIAMFLKSIKTTRYFPTKVRSIISDFAVTIAIAFMVLFDILMGLNTPKLTIPATFRPTRIDRGWFIDPIGNNPKWSIVLAILPALLATILIFMDQQITAVIVNRKENKLKKGCGYHLDLLVVAIMLIICSVLGLPWFVAATVLSITHVNSLRVESETSAPGESPKFLGVREQRVTGIMIFLMIGLSVFLTPVLRYIPMPVLYGVFLYMGVSSLKGVQFFDRIRLYFMPPKHQPDFIYLRHVPLPKVYLFTAFQTAGLVVLFVIKSFPPVSIIFPMMVAALVGIRKLFDFGIFTQQELMYLDDIIPESTKKKKEDARKKKEEEAKKLEEISMRGAGTVNVPLNGGKILKIPVSEIKYSPDDESVNISNEMAQTAIWKTLASNELGSSAELRKRCKQASQHKNQNGANKPANGPSGDSPVVPPEISITMPNDETKL